MVRLDERKLRIYHRKAGGFQFQYGTIGCSEGATKITTFIYFNSSMVRLDVEARRFQQRLLTDFNSSMVRLDVGGLIAVYVAFRDFNSSMVRLDVGVPLLS